MERTTKKKHIQRARRYVAAMNGKLNSLENLLGYIDTHKARLGAQDRRQALEIMRGWLRTGHVRSEHRSYLRELRRQLQGRE